MATTNGTLTPPSLPPAPSSPSPAKRKREPAIVTNGASVSATRNLVNGANNSLQTVLDDILSVLNSYDTHPSLLNHPITSSTRAASGEAESKRAKLTPPNGPTTITNQVQDGSYDSLEALENDVESASAEILASIAVGQLPAKQPSLEETRLQSKVLAFRKIVKTLVTREETRKAHVYGKEEVASTVDKDATATDDHSIHVKEDVPESRTVLTLYGSAQGPKQLFSSLQQPSPVPPSNGRPISNLDTAIKVTLPLRESSLPNIISTTQVYPLPEEVNDKKNKKGTTFGELFGPPANIPQLSPPKLAKPLTTKGSTITFAPQDSLPKSTRKTSYSYATQNLSTGFWLGYGGVDMPKDPTSPTAKQKSRQRALSTGEAQLPPSEATRAAVQQAKEDALFRSVYSSFAPSRDDATAIVPEETKNKIWWQKVGEKRFHDTFPIDPTLLSLDDSSEIEANGAGDEDEAFKEAVENFTPPETDPFLETTEKSELEKSTDEVLEEISDLLATLASHQRIRNSSLATNPRTPVIQNSSLASLAGSPSTPSSEEIDVYQILKSQLTLLISQLPPYAVAKLNGDQLEELNISRTIIIETKDYKGVLEEDQQSRLAKGATMPATAGPPSLSRIASTGSATHSHYPPTSSHYPRATPSVHQSAVRPVQTAQTYYPQQQSVHRSPSLHYQRSSSGPTQSYQAPVAPYVGSTPRQSYPATQAYGQQTPRPSYGQATPGQYYAQRPGPPSNYNTPGSSQFYQSTPQAQAHSRYPPQQPQNGYYPRPTNVAPMHNYGAVQSPHARTGSPLKANPPVAQPNYGSRPVYGTPVSGSQVRTSYYGQPQYNTAQAPTPTTTAPTGYSAISSNHQQMMLDRQQAQQSQARLAAQNSLINGQGLGHNSLSA